MISLNINLIQSCFLKYDDPNTYKNYIKIATKYSKVHTSIKDKKFFSNTPNKTKDEIKHWFNSLSLEAKLKVCTVENEYLVGLLKQMQYKSEEDKDYMKFSPKDDFYNDENRQSNIFTRENNNNAYNTNKNNNDSEKSINNSQHYGNNNNNSNNKAKAKKANGENENIKSLIYPANNVVLNVFKKSGKNTTAALYNSNNPNDYLEDEELKNINFDKYFKFVSNRSIFTGNKILSSNIYTISSREISRVILDNIIFYSVNHKQHIDSFTFKPEFLSDEEMFWKYFQIISNDKRPFEFLIEPYTDTKNKVFSYYLPSWFEAKNMNNSYFFFYEFILAFIEQAIVVKFVLNYNNNNKNNSSDLVVSLINDQNLNRFYEDRKNVILYLNTHYTNDNKKDILEKLLDIKTIYDTVDNDNNKKKYIQFMKIICLKNYKNYKKVIYNNSHNNDIDSINNNPYFTNSQNDTTNNNFQFSNLCLDGNIKSNLISYNNNNTNNTNNNIHNSSYNNYYFTEKSYEQVYDWLKDLLLRNDFVIFIDRIMFINLAHLYRIEGFVFNEILDKLININAEQNCLDLMSDNFDGNKSGHKKKKKKQKNKKENNKESSCDKNNNNNNENACINNSKFKSIDEEIYNPYLYIYNKKNNDKESNNKQNNNSKSNNNNSPCVVLDKKNEIAKNNNNNIEKEDIKSFIHDFIIHDLINKVFEKREVDGYINFFSKDKDTLSLDKKSNNAIKERNKDTFNKNLLIEKEDKISCTITLSEDTSSKKLEKPNKNEETKTSPVTPVTESITQPNEKNPSSKAKLNENSKESEKKPEKSALLISDIPQKNEILLQDKNEKKINEEDSLKQQNNKNSKISQEDAQVQGNDNSNCTQKQVVKLEVKKNKKPKEQNFFLFDTTKKKKKGKGKSNSPSNKESNGIESKNSLSLLLSKHEFSPIKDIHDNNNNNNIIRSKQSFINKLHNDIIKNENKVTKILIQELEFKEFCIEEIKSIIKEAFDSTNENYSIDVYGSYITGLMIETSDIDIKIKLNCNKNSNNNISSNELENLFFKLNTKLEELNSDQKFESIKPISTASVPIIKLVINPEILFKNNNKNNGHNVKDLSKKFSHFKESSLYKNYFFDKNELLKIKVDITFIVNTINSNELSVNGMPNQINENDNNCLNKSKISANLNEDSLTQASNQSSTSASTNPLITNNTKSLSPISSVEFIKDQIKLYPEVKYILRILKRYFNIKQMNSSFIGGLSSYNLFLLIAAFAKYNNIINKINNKNLGIFLIDLLKFYKDFDFIDYMIDYNSDTIIKKIELLRYKELNAGKSIVILDPLTNCNASKSSYKIKEIQRTFETAYEFFVNEEYLYEMTYDNECCKRYKSYSNNNLTFNNNFSINNNYNYNYDNDNFSLIEKFFGL